MILQIPCIFLHALKHFLICNFAKSTLFLLILLSSTPVVHQLRSFHLFLVLLALLVLLVLLDLAALEFVQLSNLNLLI